MPKRKFSVEEIKPALQIDEELGFHEKGWKIQRVGWVVIIAIFIAGLIGVFGGGGISSKAVANRNIRIKYEKFFRYQTEMKILIESKEHVKTISFHQHYLNKFRIVRFVPEPFYNTTKGDRVIYNFRDGNNLIVTIYLIPETYGSITGTMQINGVNQFELGYFIYP